MKLSPLALCALTAIAVGQTPNPTPPTAPTPVSAPQLSRPIQMQLATLAEELQQVQKDFVAVDEQVKKEHPGWHLGRDLRVEADQLPATKGGPK